MKSIEECTYCNQIKRKEIIMENENAVAVYNEKYNGSSIRVISKHHEEYLYSHPQYMLDFNMLLKNSVNYLLKKYEGKVTNYSIVHNHMLGSHLNCAIIPTMYTDEMWDLNEQ